MSKAGPDRNIWKYENCAVIVAHPDDESLWCGGFMLMHPEVKWTVVTLCRGSDADRVPKFFKAIEVLGASGVMGDLDDGPDQNPLPEREVQGTIKELLGGGKFDLVLTHSTSGEYTRHLRHEETAGAVLKLWDSNKLQAEQVWSFAYEDGGKRYLPLPCNEADMVIKLPDGIWQEKYKIITQIYGFSEDSFEARTTPKQEAFWQFKASQ